MTASDAPRPSIFELQPELLDLVRANVEAAPPLPPEAIELVNRVYPRPAVVTPKQVAS